MKKSRLGPAAPHFRVSKSTDTITDFAKAILKRCSNHKVNRFQLFDISDDLAAAMLEEIRTDYAETTIDDVAAELLPVMVDWGKYSIFRMTNAPRDYQSSWYELGVVVAKRNALYRGVDFYRDWGLYANGGRHIPHDYAIDLAATDTSDIKNMATLGSIVALKTMRGLLDRPHEYRQSHGTRTPRERMLDIPAVITLSLSRPITHVVGASGLGGGWKMPEHSVMGHERHYKSGKVIWIEGHKRGDPNVARKTTYRVIP